MSIAKTPQPPYYAVIFSSVRTEGEHGYNQMAEEMVKLAQEQEGFLGVESAREKDGFGVTISYWDSEESIRKWKENSRHKLAQKYGQEKWYSRYKTRVAKVERDYEF